MSANRNFVEIGGIEWCPTHQGVLDETSDHGDRCDMSDTCAACAGRGFLDDDEDAMCAACVGEGWQPCDARTVYFVDEQQP